MGQFRELSFVTGVGLTWSTLRRTLPCLSQINVSLKRIGVPAVTAQTPLLALPSKFQPKEMHRRENHL